MDKVKAIGNAQKIGKKGKSKEMSKVPGQKLKRARRRYQKRLRYPGQL